MTALVIRIESGQRFTDGKRRVTLRFNEADAMFSEVCFGADKFPNGLGYALSLDDRLEIEIRKVGT